MEKLENFIEKYLKSKKKTDYEGWLALYGENSEKAYRKDKTEADTAYAKSLAEHGRRASRLHSTGLTGSGYSDYLNHSAYAARADELYHARERKQKTDLENQKGYTDFLKDLSEKEQASGDEQSEYEQKLFDTLIAKGITDEEAGVTYLVNAGLAHARARELANKAVTVHRGSLSFHSRLISAATAAGMDHYSAYRYAVTQGVSDRVAHMIADAVDIAVKEKKQINYRYY